MTTKITIQIEPKYHNILKIILKSFTYPDPIHLSALGFLETFSQKAEPQIKSAVQSDTKKSIKNDN